MAIQQRRKTRIRTPKGRGRNSRLWVFLSLMLMVLIVLMLFFLRTKISQTVNIFSVEELIKQDAYIRHDERINDASNSRNAEAVINDETSNFKRSGDIIKEDYKKEDLDYLNRLIKRK